MGMKIVILVKLGAMHNFLEVYIFLQNKHLFFHQFNRKHWELQRKILTKKNTEYHVYACLVCFTMFMIAK